MRLSFYRFLLGTVDKETRRTRQIVFNITGSEEERKRKEGRRQRQPFF